MRSMMLHFRRLWPLLLILVVFLPYLGLAVDADAPTDLNYPDIDAAYTNIAQEQTKEQVVLEDNIFIDEDDVPGAETFRQAHTLLKKIRKTPIRVSRFDKPSGVLGSLVYYAKELFYLLFMNGPTKTDILGGQFPVKKLSEPLSRAIKLLETAAEEGSKDAIFELAEINFHGYFTHPRNFTRAFERYSELASMDGNDTAQHMLGFMHATGIGGVVEKNQGKALLYHTFAATAGNIQSQMTVAFRHHAGIGTPRNCEEAVHYYKKVADKAIEYTRSGPPGGRFGTKEAYRLADDDGGVYGEGASVSSSGANARQGGANSDSHAAFDDVLEYLDLMSRKGELKATFGLGRLHYDGSRALRQDFRIAREYFLDVARRYWTKAGKIRADTEPETDKLASKAAGYLGRMFLRGEGGEKNYEKARKWFRRGIENGDSLSQYSMGLMYLHGYGVPLDPVKAADYFGAAADQDLASAQVQFGALMMDQGDIATATRYFELAARNHNIEAFYYLAEMSNMATGRERNCNQAVLSYKIVAEKVDQIHSSFREANEAYEDGDVEAALPLYMMAAEQGYEAAQANVAYLLDKPLMRSPLATFFPWIKRTASNLLGDASLALMYWTRSAKQSNIDSLVKMGDYYLLGLGTENSKPDAENAAVCFQAAAETLQSAQAMWNLGWMHENGIGIEQDFHLAKRYYDQSGETNKEAYAPVAIALLKLRIRSGWNWLVGGGVKGIREDEIPKKRYTPTEWLANFIAADLEAYEAGQMGHGYDDANLDEWDSAGMPGGDDYYADGELWLDDELLEALIILGLAATLAFLVYWRQQRIMRTRREREEQLRVQAQLNGQGVGAGAGAGVGAVPVLAQAQPDAAAPPAPEQDRGLFPVPGDPEFLNWAMGGIGH